MSARVCAHPDCSNVLERHVGETTSRWKTRKCCSRACAAAMRSVGVMSDECVADTLMACVDCGVGIHRAMRVRACQAGHRRHGSHGRCQTCRKKTARGGVATARPAVEGPDPRALLQEVEHFLAFGWSVPKVCSRLGLDRDVVARALSKLPDSRTVEFRAAWERDVTNKAAA